VLRWHVDICRWIQLNNGKNASDVGAFSSTLSPAWLVDTSSGGTAQYATGDIHALAIYGGSLYAAGSITAMDVRNSSDVVAVANPVEHVMRWTGSAWVQPGGGLPAASGSTGDVLVLYPTASGLLAGGQNITGVAHAINLALWDGTSWAARRYTQGVHIRHFDAATTYGITIGGVTVSVAGTTDRGATAEALAAACNASTDPGFEAFYFWPNWTSSTQTNEFADGMVWAHGAIGGTRTIAPSVTGGTGTMSAVRDDGRVSDQETWSTRVSSYDFATTYQITIGTTTISALHSGGVTAVATALAGAGNDSLSADFSGVYLWSVVDTIFARRYDKGALSMTSSVSGGAGTMTAAANDPNYGLDLVAITGLLDVTSLNITPQYTTPSVSISAPPDLSTYTAGDSITFTGSAFDVIDGVMDATLTWTSSLDGTIGSGRTFATTALSVGTHTITAMSGQNGGGLSGSANISITVDAAPPVDNPPVVTITSPANNSSHPAGSINFTGTAIDDIDGDISASISWAYESFPPGSGSGTFGPGASASVTLAAGTWAIQAAATDSASQTGTDLIFITVT